MAFDAFSTWPIQATEFFQYHDAVLAVVVRAYPSASLDMIHDAFIEALLQVCNKNNYDPSKGKPAPFLVSATKRVLKDMVRSQTSRQRREKETGLKLVAERSSAARELLELLSNAEQSNLFRAEIARTEEERQFLELWELDVDDRNRLAAAIGAQELPPDEQEDMIKKTRDRLTIRIRRIRKRLSGEETGS